MVRLINAVNGEIRNPTRLLQLNKLCVKYNIELIYPQPLTFNNGWFSGFLDADGSIYLNEKSKQIFISLTQKNIYLLNPLISIYGGRVYPSNDRGQAFKYVIYRKNEIFHLLDHYFNRYSLKTLKHKRAVLIKEFYIARIGIDSKEINDLNKWFIFIDKWQKYSH